MKEPWQLQRDLTKRALNLGSSQFAVLCDLPSLIYDLRTVGEFLYASTLTCTAEIARDGSWRILPEGAD